MKKISTLLVSVVVLLFISCEQEQEELQSVAQVTHEKLINDLNYPVYNNTEEIIDTDPDEQQIATKSAFEFRSMWDIFEKLEEYSVDSTKTDLYNKLIEDYSHILKQSEDGSYELIVKDPVIASKFNGNGVLGLNEYVYVIEESKVYKYRTESGKLNLVEAFDRNNAIMTKASSISRSGQWKSQEIRYSVSGERKIKIYIFCESYGDLGASIGAHSSYHKDNWKDHKGDNKLEFSASRIQFTSFAGTTNEHYSVVAYDNTKDRVNLCASFRYTTMEASKKHQVENPVVTFWRDSNGSGNGFVFDTFEVPFNFPFPPPPF